MSVIGLAIHKKKHAKLMYLKSNIWSHRVANKQSKISGKLVVKPSQEDILQSEPYQNIVRCFQGIWITTFENGVH